MERGSVVNSHLIREFFHLGGTSLEFDNDGEIARSVLIMYAIAIKDHPHGGTNSPRDVFLKPVDRKRKYVIRAVGQTATFTHSQVIGATRNGVGLHGHGK